MYGQSSRLPTSRPLTLHPNLLHSHAQSAKGAALAQDENRPPSASLLAGNQRGGLLKPAGKGESIQMFCDQQENVCVQRVNRPPPSLLSTAGASCVSSNGGSSSSLPSSASHPHVSSSTATTIQTTSLHQKARRVLQEIKVDSSSSTTSSAHIPTTHTTSYHTASLLAGRRITSAPAASAAHVANTNPTSTCAAIPSLLPSAARNAPATRMATQQATTSAAPQIPSLATLNSQRPSLLSTAASARAAASAQAAYHVPLVTSAAIHSADSSHSSSIETTSASIASTSSSSTSSLHVPPSFLSNNFTASTLSTFVANSQVNTLTAMREKEQQLEEAKRKEQESEIPPVEQRSASPIMQDAEEQELAAAAAAAEEVVAELQQQQQQQSSSTASADCDDMDLCTSPSVPSSSSSASDSSDSSSSSAPPLLGAVSSFLPPSDSHLWSTDLTHEITSYWFSTELKFHPPSDYLSAQPDLNAKMREILVDWLWEVVNRFKLQPETMYLATNLLDRFLSCKAVHRKKLQLVGCVSLLLAAKYEEICIPEIRDFILISDHAYEREHILAMESILLNALRFQLTHVSSFRFLQRFLNLPGVDWMTPRGQKEECAQQLCYYLLDLTLQQVDFLQFKPSTVAASVLYIVLQHVHRLDPSAPPFLWTDLWAAETRHSALDLKPCVDMLFHYWYNMTQAGLAAMAAAANGGPQPGPGSNKCLAVYRKYGKERFGRVNEIRIIQPIIQT